MNSYWIWIVYFGTCIRTNPRSTFNKPRLHTSVGRPIYLHAYVQWMVWPLQCEHHVLNFCVLYRFYTGVKSRYSVEFWQWASIEMISAEFPAENRLMLIACSLDVIPSGESTYADRSLAWCNIYRLDDRPRRISVCGQDIKTLENSNNTFTQFNWFMFGRSTTWYIYIYIYI